MPIIVSDLLKILKREPACIIDQDVKCTTFVLLLCHLLGILLYRIKDYFWEDYDPIYEGNRSSGIVKSFKVLLQEHYRELITGKVDRFFKVRDYANAESYAQLSGQYHPEGHGYESSSRYKVRPYNTMWGLFCSYS